MIDQLQSSSYNILPINTRSRSNGVKSLRMRPNVKGTLTIHQLGYRILKLNYRSDERMRLMGNISTLRE